MSAWILKTWVLAICFTIRTFSEIQHIYFPVRSGTTRCRLLSTYYTLPLTPSPPHPPPLSLSLSPSPFPSPLTPRLLSPILLTLHYLVSPSPFPLSRPSPYPLLHLSHPLSLSLLFFFLSFISLLFSSIPFPLPIFYLLHLPQAFSSLSFTLLLLHLPCLPFSLSLTPSYLPLPFPFPSYPSLSFTLLSLSPPPPLPLPLTLYLTLPSSFSLFPHSPRVVTVIIYYSYQNLVLFSCFRVTIVLVPLLFAHIFFLCSYPSYSHSDTYSYDRYQHICCSCRYYHYHYHRVYSNLDITMFTFCFRGSHIALLFLER